MISRSLFYGYDTPLMGGAGRGAPPEWGVSPRVGGDPLIVGVEREKLVEASTTQAADEKFPSVSVEIRETILNFFPPIVAVKIVHENLVRKVRTTLNAILADESFLSFFCRHYFLQLLRAMITPKINRATIR